MSELQAVSAYVGIGFAIGWLAQWLRGGGYMGRSSAEMARNTEHRPAPPAKAPQQVQVLPANAGRIVLSYPGYMKIDQRRQAREMFNACMERGDKVLLLEGGITLVAVFAAQGEDTVTEHKIGGGTMEHRSSQHSDYGRTEIKRRPAAAPLSPEMQKVYDEACERLDKAPPASGRQGHVPPRPIPEPGSPHIEPSTPWPKT